MISASEHAEQVAFFQFVDIMANSDERYLRIFAVPNGGARHITIAKKLKAEGVKTGVPDIFVDYPMKSFHGLRIELKVGNNKPTPEQVKRLEMYRDDGYKTAVCYGAGEAIETVREYFK